MNSIEKFLTLQNKFDEDDIKANRVWRTWDRVCGFVKEVYGETLEEILNQYEKTKESRKITKKELRERLQVREKLEDLFRFRAGQECSIFKESEFIAGDQIIYIPDVELNNIPTHRPIETYELDRVMDCCYTGNEFLKMCTNRYGVAGYAYARELFDYLDWQHPSSVLDAGELD